MLLNSKKLLKIEDLVLANKLKCCCPVFAGCCRQKHTRSKKRSCSTKAAGKVSRKTFMFIYTMFFFIYWYRKALVPAACDMLCETFYTTKLELEIYYV
jgi:hypothetical protein